MPSQEYFTCATVPGIVGEARDRLHRNTLLDGLLTYGRKGSQQESLNTWQSYQMFDKNGAEYLTQLIHEHRRFWCNFGVLLWQICRNAPKSNVPE